MPRLSIKGFLKIEEANLEINRINVLIGPQAEGKSVIAKLLCFFKRDFSEAFLDSVKKLENKREFEKSLLRTFEQIFPRYSWMNDTFELTYESDEFVISITKAAKSSPKFSYCKTLASHHANLKRKYKKAMESVEHTTREKSLPDVDLLFLDVIEAYLQKSGFSQSFTNTVFIPASRSFFVTLENNVFSFLASNIEIDPLLKEFGSIYERAKRFYRMRSLPFMKIKDKKETHAKVIKLIQSIVRGEYVYRDEQDWIKNGSNYTRLVHTSSGQQESLPMLLVLSIWPFLATENPFTFLIEEPEAHLFPDSQKLIMSLLATLANATNSHFFITTHSPYVLTAINNLILANDAAEAQKENEEAMQVLESVVDLDELIPYEKVSAYTINNGRLTNIKDDDVRLIGVSLLDEVSDHFEATFDVANTLAHYDESRNA